MIQVIVQGFRDDAVIRAYFRELLVMGEEDEILPVEFLEGGQLVI